MGRAMHEHAQQRAASSSPDAPEAAEAEQRVTLGVVPVAGVTGHPDPPPIRRKLMVGSALDPAEIEADDIARRVLERLRDDGTEGPATGVSRSPSSVTRRASSDDGHGVVGPDGGDLPAGVEHDIDRHRGSGRPMPTTLRQQMEGAFGADFSGVRLHTGEHARALNDSMQAAAFTSGRDIFFRDGMPRAGHAGDQMLLAHELTHTVQQGDSPVLRTLRETDPEVMLRAIGTGRGEPIRRDLDTDTQTKPPPEGTQIQQDAPVGGTKSPAKDQTSAPTGPQSGQGQQASSTTKTPGVLCVDPSGVGHKTPDTSKAPSVLYMDPSGVGHKTPDKSTAPSVIHMDDKGVGHANPDQLNPTVESVLKQVKANAAPWSADLKAAADAGEEIERLSKVATPRAQVAKDALTAAGAAWDRESPDSGLVAARSADTARTARADTDKARQDGNVQAGIYNPAVTKLGTEKNPGRAQQHLSKVAKDKVRWLKDAGPLTQSAVAEIESVLTTEAAAWSRFLSTKPQVPTWWNALMTAETEAKDAAEATAKPLAKSSELHVITGLLQQKLNLVTPRPRLSVTSFFDDPTEAKLKVFQAAQGLPQSGVADLATWTRLDTVAPSQVKNEVERVEDETTSQTARPDAGWHPKLKLLSSGGAVRELQNRLNNFRDSASGKKPFAALKVDGTFGLKTQSALKDFQKDKGLKKTGVADQTTWDELDKVGTVSSGTRQFESTQICEGMLTGGTAKYAWQVTQDNKLVITVKINFTGEKKHPRVARWLQDIKDVWNGFKAVEEGGVHEYDIVFNPVVSSSGHKVKVCKPTKADPTPRSDSANWYVNDPRKGLAPHEFGHLVGLDDEYNRPEEQYVVTTGQEPKVGQFKSTTGKTSSQVAELIHNAIVATDGQPGEDVAAAIANVVKAEQLCQGSFTRLVAQRYETAYGFEGRRDITRYFALKSKGQWTSDLTEATEPFSESNTSIMGTMESITDDSATGADLAALPPHEHPVQPRHLRSFTDLLKLAMPGTRWKVAQQ